MRSQQGGECKGNSHRLPHVTSSKRPWSLYLPLLGCTLPKGPRSACLPNQEQLGSNCT